jgi:hypothetical protein
MVPALRSWRDRYVFVRGVLGPDHRPTWGQRVVRVARR